MRFLKIIVPGGLLLLAFSTQASLFKGKIEGFELATCQASHCFCLKSPLAHIGHIDGSLAFDEATLIIGNRSIASKDVYFDRKLRKIFLRNVDGSEYVFDVGRNELTRY
jgi:hypothetical protein